MSSADRSDASSSTAHARLLTSVESRESAVSEGICEGRLALLRPSALRIRAMNSLRSLIRTSAEWIPCVGGRGKLSPRSTDGPGRDSRPVSSTGQARCGNHPRRLRPATPKDEMTPPSPFRTAGDGRGLDGGRFLRSRNPACAGMTDGRLAAIFVPTTSALTHPARRPASAP